MPKLRFTITFVVAISLLTTVCFSETKKTQNDSETNIEIDNEAIGGHQQQKNTNSTTEEVIQQLINQLQQIHQKISIIHNHLSKQHNQEPSRRVEAVQQQKQQQQQQQQPVGAVKLNTARLNSSTVVEDRKMNSSLKAQIKEFRQRFASPRDQFRKFARVKDQPQTLITPPIDKTILKEIPPNSQLRQPLPVAKSGANKPTNETQNFIITQHQPKTLPVATAQLPPLTNKIFNQTISNGTTIIDKNTEAISNLSIAVTCPKKEWQKIMEKAIKSNDPNTSIKQIQAELANSEHGIFVVMCSLVDQREQFAKNLKLKGDTYCQVIKDNVWCHAGGLSLKNGATFQIGRR